MIEKAVDDLQAYLASPVGSLPAMSETLPAETENGNSVAVKTKLDKRFIVLYSLNLKFQTVHFYLTTKVENNLQA